MGKISHLFCDNVMYLLLSSLSSSCLTDCNNCPVFPQALMADYDRVQKSHDDLLKQLQGSLHQKDVTIEVIVDRRWICTPIIMWTVLQTYPDIHDMPTVNQQFS